MDLLSVAVALCATGLATGLLAGMLGVGGGVIIVPVLIEIYRAIGLPPSSGALTAIGTSQAAMVVASVAAALAHRRGAGLDRQILHLWLLPTMAGALAGILGARIAPTAWLIVAFIVVGLLMSLQLLLGGRWTVTDRLPRGAAGTVAPFLVGSLAASLGVGAGTLGVPALTIFNTPIHRSLGATSVLAALVAVLAMTGFVVLGWNEAGRPDGAFGYVDLGAAAVLSAGALLAAPVGARLARRLPARVLQIAFAAVLWGVAARMFWMI